MRLCDETLSFVRVTENGRRHTGRTTEMINKAESGDLLVFWGSNEVHYWANKLQGLGIRCTSYSNYCKGAGDRGLTGKVYFDHLVEQKLIEQALESVAKELNYGR